MEDGKDKASKELGTLTGGASSSTTSEPDGDIKDANGKEFIAQLASTGLWKFHSLLNRKPVAPSGVPPPPPPPPPGPPPPCTPVEEACSALENKTLNTLIKMTN